MSVLTSLRSRVPSSVTARVLTTRNRAMTFAQVRHPVLAGVIIRRLTGGSGSHGGSHGTSHGAGGDAAGGGTGAPVADGRRHSGIAAADAVAGPLSRPNPGPDAVTRTSGILAAKAAAAPRVPARTLAR
ncbi:hypothetical protein QDW14_09190 [Corynebacterium bovis]|uniref:hypothetical protein n=1 Tax=Corynebacterium bovis TaxID=36808 RepID=UPI0024480765|nr:hypothetical protein [Corynebacterium bovis]MDH2456637.1 hypothetical protein [Corynebacterium bovis]